MISFKIKSYAKINLALNVTGKYTKLHKIEQVIDHYEPDIQDLDDTVVDLALEREKRL